MDGDLAARVRKLEDIEAIRALKGLYSKLADAKYTADHRRLPQDELDAVAERQAAVFTEDAVWDGGGQFGVQRGRQAIYENLRAGPWAFAMHQFIPQVIEVDGDAATGVWSLWQVGTLTQGDTSVFLSAITEDAYRRTPEGWRQSAMRFTLKFMTPFDIPWSRRKNAPLTL
jgi:hypothetical protein